MNVSFWDERFKSAEFIYGEDPNEFLKEQLKDLKPGKILLPADGEGRNGVYAAESGWEVTSFDQSLEGRKKALALAGKRDVEISYLLSGVEKIRLQPDSFDVVALIYAHFTEKNRRNYHKKLISFLKSGGRVILEAFSKKQIINQRTNPQAGGPKSPDQLYSLQELKKDFEGCDFKIEREETVELKEGEFHKGKGDVIRIVARKR